ncbi:MAG: hypothetical protein HQL37_07470, partial [Alphaproteobacteria bacterium]|nr:hypothetical protein [Alphaproteobacteria bacterium]
PEEPGLSAWLRHHTRSRAVSLERLRQGAITGDLAALLAQPAPFPAVPSGVETAAALIAGWLADG